MKIKIDGFVLSILATVVLAYFVPFFGTPNSPISIDSISHWGIALIFFFYGLKLSPDKLRAGLSNWKLHVLVQASTFVLFPLLVLLLKPFAPAAALYQQLWLGLFFMAALPSTVSSSVVMVSLAKGNVAAAIFNASISGIIGIAITPLWMGLFVDANSAAFDLTTVYTDLLLQILLPVGLGLLLQKFLGAWAMRYATALNYFDKSIILMIIYKSFATAFTDGLFESISWPLLGGLLVVVLLVFFIAYQLIQKTAKALGFSEADQITATFCGSKKSLVHGTVFSAVLFAKSPYLGLILLPIMMYHALQILIISFIAQKK